MINEKVIDAMNEIDDDLLDEALFGYNAEQSAILRKKRRLSRRAVVAILAAVLVLVCGIGIYASGVLTASVEVYKSSEATKKKSFMYDENGNEIDHINIDVKLPAIYERDIKGPIREDAAALLSEKVAKDDRAWCYSSNDPNAVNEIVTYDFFDLTEYKKFSNQKDLLEFIGCEYFEEQYFPYENYEILLDYNAVVSVGQDIDDLRIRGLHYGLSSIDEPITISTWTTVFLKETEPEEDDYGYTGFGGIIDDGTSTVETIKNVNGYNGAKLAANEGMCDNYFASACIVKNNCYYMIGLSCGWDHAEEAQQILQTWIDNF